MSGSQMHVYMLLEVIMDGQEMLHRQFAVPNLGSFMGLIDDVTKLPIFRIWSCLKRFDASYL